MKRRGFLSLFYSTPAAVALTNFGPSSQLVSGVVSPSCASAVTDQVINLGSMFHIDDYTARMLYGGSITQVSGNVAS